MPNILGVDVSHYQTPPLPWFLWRAQGVRFAYIRAGLGYVGDWDANRHRKEARAAGLYTGAYWAILHHDTETAFFDPVQSARNFSRMIEPGDELPPMVDVEALGVNAAMLTAFLNEFDRLRPASGVGIYTSAYFWRRLIGPGHFEFAKRPLWIAMYGINGAQDPPHLPDIWKDYVCYQFRYKAGYLPGYARDLDIDLWSGDLPMPATNDQLKGLIAEANLMQEDANVLIAAGTAMKAKALDMAQKMNGMLAATPPPPPPPPPPPVKHTMRDKTNQGVINTFAKAFGVEPPTAPAYIAAIGRAGLNGILPGGAGRQAMYAGPAVEDLPLTADEKAKVIAAL